MCLGIEAGREVQICNFTNLGTCEVVILDNLINLYLKTEKLLLNICNKKFVSFNDTCFNYRCCACLTPKGSIIYFFKTEETTRNHAGFLLRMKYQQSRSLNSTSEGLCGKVSFQNSTILSFMIGAQL